MRWRPTESETALAQCGGHASFQKSARDERGGDLIVQNDGVAEFPDGQTQKKPEGQRKIKFGATGDSGRALHHAGFYAPAAKLEMQFQQADFQRERFLHVRVQQPLDLFQRQQVFPGLMGEIRRATVSAPEHQGNVSNVSPAGGQGVEPDVPQPGLHQPEQVSAAPAIFRLDGGGQLILPFVAQIRFQVLVFFQRRTGGEGFIHADANLAQFLQQDIQQPVTAQHALLFPGRERAEFLQPLGFRGSSSGGRRRNNSGAGSATKWFPKSGTARWRAGSGWNWPGAPPVFSGTHWRPGDSTGRRRK
jgi:hypothetical protein